MYQLESSPGRIALVDGKEYLFFTGYSYLGMSAIPEFKALVFEGIEQYGLLHPSSRISNTTLSIYEALESKLSQQTKTEETVSFSSGYLAGRAITKLLANEKHAYILPNTHAVLHHHQKQVIDAAQLVKEVNASAAERVIIFSDSVNPLEASVNDYSFLQDIDNAIKVICIIDDSHGIGLIGNNGNGITDLLPNLSNIEYVFTYSLSKAYHINGGAVSCNTQIAKQLRHSPYYTASTPIAPAMVYAFLHGDQLYNQQQKKLQQNVTAFIELIKDNSEIVYDKGLSIFKLKEAWDGAIFDQHNVIISSFSYPDPTGKKVNRIVFNALHTEADLVKIAEIIKQLP